MDQRQRFFRLLPFMLVGFAAFVALGGLVVRELWNWLLPNLFGWPSITFWQALGLLVLCRILFGGFTMQDSSRTERRRRLAERWEKMTPEERERFRQSWRVRWGLVPADPGSSSEGRG